MNEALTYKYLLSTPICINANILKWLLKNNTIDKYYPRHNNDSMRYSIVVNEIRCYLQEDIEG